jgi:hypothetical protein
MAEEAREGDCAEQMVGITAAGVVKKATCSVSRFHLISITHYYPNLL